MNKNAVISITDAIDADSVCARLDVKPRSLRLARERGIFPASWFLVIQNECNALGIDCPESAFNFKAEADA